MIYTKQTEAISEPSSTYSEMWHSDISICQEAWSLSHWNVIICCKSAVTTTAIMWIERRVIYWQRKCYSDQFISLASRNTTSINMRHNDNFEPTSIPLGILGSGMTNGTHLGKCWVLYPAKNLIPDLQSNRVIHWSNSQSTNLPTWIQEPEHPAAATTKSI